MRLIGRKVIFGGWSNNAGVRKEVGLEIRINPPDPVPDGEARLFDIYDNDGERIERPLGPPAFYASGRSLNDYIRDGEIWLTKADIERMDKEKNSD